MTVRLTPEDVRRIAALARLHLTDDEAAQFAGQFEGVLELLERVRSVPVEGAPSLLHPLRVTDVLRDDAPCEGLTRADALGGAPDVADDLFRVPRVLPAGGE